MLAIPEAHRDGAPVADLLATRTRFLGMARSTSVPYAIGRTGLIHDPACRVLGEVAWTTPTRTGALKVGDRMARCCLGNRVATRPDPTVAWKPRAARALPPPVRKERPLA